MSPSSRSLATYISLIHFNLSGQGIDIFGHELTNLFEYPPSCFVGDTQFPLELLGRDTCLGRSHKEYSVKPRTERGVRFVEDSASSWGNMRITELTGINLPISDSVVSSDFLALLTEDTLRPASCLEEVKAGIVIRELFLKIFEV